MEQRHLAFRADSGRTRKSGGDKRRKMLVGRGLSAMIVEAFDLVDEWGRQSFPASDPPANW